MYLGLDLGTSALKALLVDDDERVVADAQAPISSSRPRPGWSEQNPADWLAAAISAVDALHREHPTAVSAVRSIGLSGQMHGAVLLDQGDVALRPCILWNDGRAEEECCILRERMPDLAEVTGNLAMPGFTAPKLLWVARHEPDIFRQVRRVLLPKAWLRLAMTGEAVEDMSDASGTLWLDVGRREWSEAALAATGLGLEAMPRLVEGNQPAGRLNAALTKRWRMATAPIFAGGAGDNAAGAVGLSAVAQGDAFVSLGTSGVVWITTDAFRPFPSSAVHAFCHALPGLWHQMGVTLSAAACLSWWAAIVGRSEGELLAELNEITRPSAATFLPYLAGERTPHNDASLRGRFCDLSASAGRQDLTQAVLEGVAFALRDCADALRAGGGALTHAIVIGGGSRSRAWTKILANVLGIPLHRLPDGERGAAFGAARLARLAATGEDPRAICRRPAPIETIEPDAALSPAYAERQIRFRSLR